MMARQINPAGNGHNGSNPKVPNSHEPNPQADNDNQLSKIAKLVAGDESKVEFGKARILNLSRKQFEPLSEDWATKIDVALNDQLWQDPMVTNEHYTLNNEDIRDLIEPTSRDVSYSEFNMYDYRNTPPSIAEAYSGCIARYLNNGTTIKLEKPNSRRCLILSAHFSKLFTWSRGPKFSEIQTELENQGCSGTDLLEVDYLFIPWYIEAQNHWILCGAAPKQEFLFVVDSIHREFMHKQQLRFVEKILIANIPNYKRGWPVLEPKGKKVTDRQNVTQRDAHSCAVFVLTNMFCLGFGFQLTCYAESDIHNKRRRMAAELLNGGFSGTFAYEAMPIPVKFKDFEALGHRPAKRAFGNWHDGEVELGSTAHVTDQIKDSPQDSAAKDPELVAWEERKAMWDGLSDYARRRGGFPAQFSPLEFNMLPSIEAATEGDNGNAGLPAGRRGRKRKGDENMSGEKLAKKQTVTQKLRSLQLARRVDQESLQADEKVEGTIETAATRKSTGSKKKDVTFEEAEKK